MSLQFKLPDIGEGVAEGEIVKWLVKAGDPVDEHQAVVEVMTDKATVEIPSPRKGRISKLLAAAGDRVPVGSVIFELDEGTANAPAAAPGSASHAPGQRSAPAPQPAPAMPKSPAMPKAAVSSQAAARLEFRLPDIGEGVAEGEVVKWLVEPGANVAEHQSVVEVMTDKATVEIPAPAAGRLLEWKAKAGERLAVGEVLFVLETTGANAPARAKEHVAAAHTPAAAPKSMATAAAGAGADLSNGKVVAVPSARRVARELGIDLAGVRGTGRNGVVRRSDVEAFAKRPAAATPAKSAGFAPIAAGPAISLTQGPGERRVPFRGVRRKISEAMVRSKFTAPHFTVVEELDVTELVALREKAKAMAAESSVKLTYMPFIMKAVANGLAKYPELNCKLDEAAQEIVTYEHVHLGIATDTPNGLIVPVIRDVQQKGLLQLAKELVDLADRTRGGKVTPEELRGSTFSITNAGNIGGTLATPIINFPDVGILGVHRIVKRPGVVETPSGDKIEVREYMNLSISVDHRLVDGATAVRFLVHLKRLLEAPGLLAL